MLVKVELDRKTSDKLFKVALSERRPINLQAEVLLIRALGLPFPCEPTVADNQSEKSASQKAAA